MGIKILYTETVWNMARRLSETFKRRKGSKLANSSSHSISFLSMCTTSWATHRHSSARVRQAFLEQPVLHFAAQAQSGADSKLHCSWSRPAVLVLCTASCNCSNNKNTYLQELGSTATNSDSERYYASTLLYGLSLHFITFTLGS